MNKQIFILLIFLLILSTIKSLAGINLKTGGFETDIKINNIITVHYNSRSLYYGFWGFGWCSNLEQKLILAKIKYILRCGVNDKTQIFEAKNYFYYKKQGFEYRFEKSGKLIGIVKNNILFRLLYLNGKITKLLGDNNSEILIYYTDEEGLIRKVISPNHYREFEYQNYLLTQTYANKQISLSFNYDELNNLTRISHPIGTYERMEYDMERDRLMRYTGRDLCEISLYYSELNGKTHFLSEFQKKCGEKKETGNVEFFLEKKDNGLFEVKKIKRVQGSDVVEFKINKNTYGE